MRDIYTTMLKVYFKLPDEVGRIKPRLIFDLVNSLVEDDTPSMASIPPQYRTFYGL